MGPVTTQQGDGITGGGWLMSSGQKTRGRAHSMDIEALRAILQ